MKKLGIAALLAAGIVAAAPSGAQAAEITGPCAVQQGLFEKYNIELNMNAPAVAWAYNTACDVTG